MTAFVRAAAGAPGRANDMDFQVAREVQYKVVTNGRDSGVTMEW